MLLLLVTLQLASHMTETLWSVMVREEPTWTIPTDIADSLVGKWISSSNIFLLNDGGVLLLLFNAACLVILLELHVELAFALRLRSVRHYPLLEFHSP